MVICWLCEFRDDFATWRPELVYEIFVDPWLESLVMIETPIETLMLVRGV